MNTKLETVLKAALLAALGLMFYSKISTGTLAFYINQRFAWLSFAAVLIFLALALTVIYRLMQTRATSERVPAGLPVEVDVDDDEPVDLAVTKARLKPQVHSAGGHSHRMSWLGLAILGLPVLIGFLAPARPLGAGAIDSRGIGLSAPNRPGSGSVTQVQRVASGPKNILDWLRDFSRTTDASAFTGQTADVIGFVYKDPRSKPNEFWVSRFAVSCCVADATALGLLVRTEQAASLKPDSWVHVVGKFKPGEFAGEKIPVITAEKVEPTEQPKQPYLYP
jgi:uncharacterized repeat protein (TIGR03943 family)